jgi:hypothetical protein
MPTSILQGELVTGHGDAQTIIPGDGAITVASGAVSLTKGSAAAITIAAPVSGSPASIPNGQDGTRITIFSETAFAHVVTCASVGFNGKAASGTLTFAAAKGNGVTLEARGGQWWVISNIGVTVA